MTDLTDQIAIVTGATGNLGRAVATAAARRGARLVLADFRGEALNDLLGHLEGGPHATVAGQDVRTEAGAKAIVEATISRFGRVDALVNTVGGYKTAPLLQGGTDQFSEMMEINAKAAMLLSAAVLPTMIEQRYGRIVHVSAGAAFRSFANAGAYAASKAALLRLTETISEEHKLEGVTANCVLPAIIDTPQNRQAMPGEDHSRWTPPADIAEVILFLCSRQSSAITGAAIPVSGRQ